MSTKAFLNSDRDGYFIEEKDIFDSAQDLLCILPSNNAEMINIAAKKDHKNLQEKFSQYKNIFQGNFFIGALSFNEQYDQTTQFICEEATNADISVVALNDVCFISQDDHLAHQAKVAINNATLLKDEIDSPNISQEQYF